MRDENGGPRLYEGKELQDLPILLPYLEALPHVTITEKEYQPGIPGKLSGEWSLSFTWKSYPITLYTNYHTASTIYEVGFPPCPEPLLHEVKNYLESLEPPRPPYHKPPELNRRRLFLLFLFALPIAVVLVVFLVIFRRGE